MPMLLPETLNELMEELWLLSGLLISMNIPIYAPFIYIIYKKFMKDQQDIQDENCIVVGKHNESIYKNLHANEIKFSLR